ncbi:phage portal protein [Pantoea sp. ICBG 1758]|uniref:phage portal protein n=1 Tax=Pantoea sp. ICBG 1758 TaxID=2071682 RepID=UPI000CE526C7|nr:phage portal protein [Pantoea sp. ICBG 1758]PPC63917.1 phage portal protein [Pantoea sp. ICBG 1758]
MFNFLRRKPKEKSKALHSLHAGAWSRVLEPFGGAWQRNIEIRLDSVLAFPAIFSCISLISADIAKMPVAVKRRQSNGVWVKVNNPELTPLLEKPNFYQTSMQFFELWMISKLAHGNAYILKLRDEAGRVRQLRVLDPRRVIPYISDDGEIFYSILTDELNGLPGGLYVPARELIHDRFNTFFHPLCGLSPVYASGLAAIGGEAMLRNSAHTFKNGGKPGGIITVPGSVDADKAREIKDNWNEGYTGENAGKTALLADGAAFVAVAQTATDSQLVEQLNLSNQLVASTFRVPLYKIDTGQTPSYNNIEALEQAYYSQCLQVHMTAIEGLLADTFDLNDQTCVEFDHSRLLRMDTAARYKSYGDGIGAGFLAPNEARIKENMDPVEGGDTPYLQQQNYSLEALAKRDAQDNPFSSSSGSSSINSDDDSSDNNPPASNQPDPNQPLTENEAENVRALILYYEHSENNENEMISEREMSLIKTLGQSTHEIIKEAVDNIRDEFQPHLEDKDNTIAYLNKNLQEAYEINLKCHTLLTEHKELVLDLKKEVEEIEKNAVDESAIASMVYAMIEIPDAPELPDIPAIVKDAVSHIPIPVHEPLPDIAEMVLNAVRVAREGDPSAEDIAEMVRKAVGEIEIPKPEPAIPPDIEAIIDQVVEQFVQPEPEPLPDIKAMVEEAVSRITIPQPEPLPDIGAMVKSAIEAIPIPQPEPLPDFAQMIEKAVSEIEIPQPEPLPDVEKMVNAAVDRIEVYQPEPLPDFSVMVKEAVDLAVAAIELPKPEPLPDFKTIIKSAIENIRLPEPSPLPDIPAMISDAIEAFTPPEPDVKAIAREVMRQIPVPEIEPLPDFASMIQKAVSEIDLPEPEPLPDIQQLVEEAVKGIDIPIPEPKPLPDIKAMVKEAVSSIAIPQPKDPEPLPDIQQMVEEAMKGIDIPIPEPQPLPDIKAMVQEAVSSIAIPQPKDPEPLPDIQQLVEEAVKGIDIPIPEPQPLPDIKAMIQEAVSAIEIPKPKDPEPLPDIARLLERAVSEYPMPEPEPLPDIEKMVREAVAAIEIPQPKEPEPLPDIAALVAGAVAGIQFPDPEPIELPDFAKMIAEAVQNAVAALPAPEPGKGEDGKDGLQIEVLPEINVNKSYPRGTYAIHNGGLWRAYQKTSGLSGFECVVNGLNDIDVNVEGDRHFTVRMSKSNGETEERDFTLPVMIYRDVYQAGQTYYPGDCVTFGGSIWHCYEETDNRPNDVGSTGWRLAVKKGRDGRSNS